MTQGKHKTTGVGVQVACTLSGRLAWVSDPQDGRIHDTEALRRCGLLDVPATGASPPRHIGDKGYNRAVNQVRYKIERVIDNTQDLARPAHRPQKTTRNLPNNHQAILGILFTYTP